MARPVTPQLMDLRGPGSRREAGLVAAMLRTGPFWSAAGMAHCSGRRTARVGTIRLQRCLPECTTMSSMAAVFLPCTITRVVSTRRPTERRGRSGPRRSPPPRCWATEAGGLWGLAPVAQSFNRWMARLGHWVRAARRPTSRGLRMATDALLRRPQVIWCWFPTRGRLRPHPRQPSPFSRSRRRSRRARARS